MKMYFGNFKRKPETKNFFNWKRLFLVLQVLFILPHCGGGSQNSSSGLSVLPIDENFKKEGQTFRRRDIDILWVIDNSGSMGPYQQRVQNSAEAFIEQFEDHKFQFHIAVTTTEAYVSDSNAVWQGDSGTKVITPETPGLELAFQLNVAGAGTGGSITEKHLESLKDALEYQANSAFFRRGSFLSVIIVSDENDTASSGDLAHYTEFLNKLTKSSVPGEYYSVSVILPLTSSSGCTQVADQSGILIQIAKETDGSRVNLCDADYSNHLRRISKTIIEQSTFFPLAKKPDEDSIQVIVDGKKVPKNSTNGWSYRKRQNGVFFHGIHIPQDEAKVNISYQPEKLEI